MIKKNVLVAGIGQTNYIFQLYGSIGPKLQNFNFNSINLKKFGDSVIENQANKIFQKNYHYKFHFHNIIQVLQALLKIFCSRIFWKDHRISIAEIGWKHLKHGFYLNKKHISAYHYAKFIDRETDTDIIHLHFPSHGNSLFLEYLNRDYILIQTFWGSDIYRIKSWLTHEIQKETLRKSDIITTATPEMKFALITRYGSGFEDKIKTARFIHDRSFYKFADHFIQDTRWKSEYLQKFKIPENKKIILFGHNAFKENNHLKFLDTLKIIPPEILNKYHVIFPLTYPEHQRDYIEKIKFHFNGLPSSFTFLTEFLNWEDMAKLKIVSDIYIHAPTTDGLSAFLTEFLYTGNLAIVGSWLPYKTFSKLGVKYIEFDVFDELIKILQDLEFYSINYSGNREVIGENFNDKVIAKEWLKVFDELRKNHLNE